MPSVAGRRLSNLRRNRHERFTLLGDGKNVVATRACNVYISRSAARGSLRRLRWKF
jgi:hypothetical protein